LPQQPISLGSIDSLLWTTSVSDFTCDAVPSSLKNPRAEMAARVFISFCTGARELPLFELTGRSRATREPAFIRLSHMVLLLIEGRIRGLCRPRLTAIEGAFIWPLDDGEMASWGEHSHVDVCLKCQRPLHVCMLQFQTPQSVGVGKIEPWTVASWLLFLVMHAITGFP
jgi:hypothetical protein